MTDNASQVMRPSNTTQIDAVPGVYNIVELDEWKTADYQLPVEEFVSRLSERDLHEEVCVVGLEDVLSEEKELRDRLIAVMRAEMDYLNNLHPLPSIQFAVDGDFQSVGDSFEVAIASETHSLQIIFGRHIQQRRDGWLVTPFRV